MFECNNCGQNSVSRYGAWCDECARKEMEADALNDSIWYSKIALCITCCNADGADWGDKCMHYNMPLYMVGRKRKCKHYKEYREMSVSRSD